MLLYFLLFLIALLIFGNLTPSQRDAILSLRRSIKPEWIEAVKTIDTAYQVGLTGNPGFVPKVALPTTESTPLGNMALLGMLGSSKTAVVHLGILGDQKFALKYTTAPSEGLARDYSILAYLNNTGIAPNVYAISERVTALVGWRNTAKLGPHLQEGSKSLRVIIEEPLGPSLDRYFEKLNAAIGNRSLYVSKIVAAGIKALQLLRTLHSKGIVHGDIHGGNIVFKQMAEEGYLHDPSLDDLALIDFDQSIFYPERIGNIVNGKVSSMKNPMLMTPWGLDGERIGRRDDVYSLFELIAVYLSHFKLDDRIFELQERMWKGSRDASIGVCVENTKQSVACFYMIRS